jgi:phenylalanyl-tRNA synthetase beta chain
MLVSWEWLSQYVKLDASPDDLATRFAMVGLNHESTTYVDGDPVVDLEITSNRGDCLGHIGIAREASVLLKETLTIPNPSIASANLSKQSMHGSFAIENRYPEGCSRYQARIIRGVKIGPSPVWLQMRLKAIGIKSVNNVVDVTNFVMFECGQPLHAFDLAKLRGNKIIIRRADAGEKFVAIDHRTYELDPNMVVIADAERAVALGGVMGGVDSEVSEATTDLLIESAAFTPLAIRRCARKLRLHSPASYRFERRVDPNGQTWATDRCCQLITEIAGGQCSPDAMDTASDIPVCAPITLRQNRVEKVLGIDIPWEQSIDILRSLGCIAKPATGTTEKTVAITPPSFRGDLTREVDLIEEIARVYGYDRIPENATVPIFVSSKRPKDVLLERVRSVATSVGLSEALTPSVVNKSGNDAMSPWTDVHALQTQVPLLEGTTFLRRTIVPSLLQVYLFNQSQQQREAALFETAILYLPIEKPGALPREQFSLGWAAPFESRILSGMVEEFIHRVAGRQKAASLNTTLKSFTAPYIQEGTGLWLEVNGQRLSWQGKLSRSLRDTLKIDADLSIGEIDLDLLLTHIELIPRLTPIVPYPVIQRDLNLIVDEAIRWQQLADVVLKAAGSTLIDIRYCETYRDPKKDGLGSKRVLFSMDFQSRDGTLTSDFADQVVQGVLTATGTQLGAKLLA